MNTRTIVRNTLWYGLERGIDFLATLVTSIVIARTLGPAKMAYIIFVNLIVSQVGSLGSLGIPATTRKYMAEFFGAGDLGTARSVYRTTLRVQAVMASIATVLAVTWVLWKAPTEFRLAALLLVLSILPSMVNFISAQANVASEQLRANMPASAAATLVLVLGIMLMLAFHWGVTGVAAAMLAMRLADFTVRFVPTWQRIQRWPVAVVPVHLNLGQRMFRFAVQGVLGMILTMIVWDRFEVYLLKWLSTDIRQIAFYSVAFSLAERLLIFPAIFVEAVGASAFAQFGRDRTQLPAMIANAVRYLSLVAIPLHLVVTPLAGALLLVMYGNKYAGAITVAMIAPLMALPKAFLGPIQTLFETMERQSYFLLSCVGAAALDIGLACWLIPHRNLIGGAVGAALASGSAQMLAVGTLWALGVRKYRIPIHWRFLGKLVIISVVAAMPSIYIVHHAKPLPGLLFGSATALVCLLGMAWLLRLLEQQDVDRLGHLLQAVPPRFAAPALGVHQWLCQRVAITEEVL